MNDNDIDLDKLMAEIFGSQKSAEETFYLWYDELNRIVGLSGTILEEYSHHNRITIDLQTFEQLNNDNLLNYIVDVSKTPPEPVDISSSDVVKNVNVPRVQQWATDRLVIIQYARSTRKLFVNVKSQLPSAKKAWIIPAGNFMVPLVELNLHQIGNFEYNVPVWLDSNSCWCISENPIEIFTAYREVEHEEDL